MKTAIAGAPSTTGMITITIVIAIATIRRDSCASHDTFAI
jgi:predicted S18 family serine protease